MNFLLSEFERVVVEDYSCKKKKKFSQALISQESGIAGRG